VRGLALPIVVVQGRARICDGEEQVAKLVLLSMLDGESANPFNGDVGLSAPVFSLDSGATRAKISRSITRNFARLQAGGRAKLLSISFDTPKGDEAVVRVRYRDLETDEEREVVRDVRRA